MASFSRVGWVLLLAWLTPALHASAQESPPLGSESSTTEGIDPTEVVRWPLERVILKNGKSLSGLVRHEGPKFIELVEVRRQPGEPMRRVVRLVRREKVESIERLDELGRLRLSMRLREFLRRTEVLEGMLEDIELARTEIEGRSWLQYGGPWFTMRSRADEATTRLAVVRLEQVFAGFRTYLVPRIRPRQSLQIVILGSLPEYEALRAARNLDVKQTAFYDPTRNEIVAGGELASLAAELEKVTAHHESLLQQLRHDRELAERQIETLRRTLREAGNTTRQVSVAIRAAGAEWKKLWEDLDRQIKQARRRNDAVYQAMFRHLYHEAFHAYASNFVYEDAAERMPRWLGEGWAQIFEAGLLEAGALRVDAPSASRLERLKQELRGPNSLSVKDVLIAPDQQFTVIHEQSAVEMSRLYLYSWGLAYHLTFHRQLLGSSAMDEFLRVGKSQGPALDIVRFEKLVGQPLVKFEQAWREAMLKEGDGGRQR